MGKLKIILLLLGGSLLIGFGLLGAGGAENYNQITAERPHVVPSSAEAETFGKQSDTVTVLITTDREEYREPFATKLAVWLRAVFPTEVRVISQQELGGENLSLLLDRAGAIIYYGTDYGSPPSLELIDYLFQRLYDQATKLVWIGYHGDRLVGHSEGYGVVYDGLIKNERPRQVLYLEAETSYLLPHQDLILLQVGGSGIARARVTLDADPIVVSGHHQDSLSGKDNFYYFGFHPTSFLNAEGVHLIYLDLMHEVFDINRSHAAVIRLEDVNPSTDPAALAEVVDYLSESDIPFVISLIPFYIGIDSRLVALRERPALVEVVQAALERGGEIVLHGATHQFKGVTGVDSEFWDEATEEPIDDLNYVLARVQLGLVELEANGLLEKTVGWETPHNPFRAGETAYQVFENRFSLIYDNPRWSYDLKWIPYPIVRGDTTYISTNLGYYRTDQSVAQIDSKLARAGKIISLQKGGVVSFFYHPWLGAEKLHLLVKGLTEQGWSFRSVSSVAAEYTATESRG
ncbi:MAG: DUF2334 domain-containing protein [Candidatus Bipolaricaulota bacterium]